MEEVAVSHMDFLPALEPIAAHWTILPQAKLARFEQNVCYEKETHRYDSHIV